VPLRDYADDYFHTKILIPPYQQALVAMIEITTMGKVLAGLKSKVFVPDLIMLEIGGREYGVHGFASHFCIKWLGILP